MCNSITSYGRMSLPNSKYLKKEKLHSRFLSTAKKINIYGKLHKLQLISDLNDTRRRKKTLDLTEFV